MKKIIGILSILSMCFCLLGCGEDKIEEWSIADFSFYNEEGKEVDFPSDNKIAISESEDKLGMQLKTKRGVAIGDRAETALAKYNLDGFYFSVADYKYINPSTEESKIINQEFHEKYPTLKDALPHFDEISAQEMSIFASMSFYEIDENLKQCTLDELGNVVDDDEMRMKATKKYKVIFIIDKEKISEIKFESNIYK